MKSFSLFISFSLFLFFFSQLNPAFSQNFKVDPELNQKVRQAYIINGIALNQDNDPILHAAVVVIGTSTGSATNQLGQFVLIVPSLPVTIRVTAIGCTSTDTVVPFNNSRNLKIRLNCDDNNTSVLNISDQKKIDEFSKGKMEIPILLRDKIILGKFDFEKLSLPVTEN